MAEHRDRIHIGTSGWSYRDWRESFYAGASPRDHLAIYARNFETVEVNNSFYRLPSEETFESWRDTVPPDFTFAVKASRFLTHMKKLRDPEQPIALMLDRFERLGDRLGPILFQFPPRWHKDAGRLGAFLRLLPRDHRYACEFRDPTWFDREVYDLLAEHRVALCIYDLAGRHSPQVTTTDLIYLRFHKPSGDRWEYDHDELAGWADAIVAWVSAGHAVYGYFNNDPGGAAPRNAKVLLELLERAPEPATHSRRPEGGSVG